MNPHLAWLVPLLSCLSIACNGSDPSGGAGGSGGGAGAGAGGSGGSTTTCPFTMIVDENDTYGATWCNIQGAKTFSSGLYQVSVAARFNDLQPIRSIDFDIYDSDLATETHIKTYPVGSTNPGVNSTYHPTPTEEWGTLENQIVVGSGSFDLTRYDRVAKLFSGTFDIIVKQGTAEKHLTGTLTDVPMQTAE